jgi:hypothetical protein
MTHAVVAIIGESQWRWRWAQRMEEWARGGGGGVSASQGGGASASRHQAFGVGLLAPKTGSGASGAILAGATLKLGAGRWWYVGEVQRFFHRLPKKLTKIVFINRRSQFSCSELTWEPGLEPVGVFCTGKNSVVKITCSNSEMVLQTTKRTMIYPGSSPFLEVVALCPAIWYWRWTEVTKVWAESLRSSRSEGGNDLVPPTWMVGGLL